MELMTDRKRKAQTNCGFLLTTLVFGMPNGCSPYMDHLTEQGSGIDRQVKLLEEGRFLRRLCPTEWTRGHKSHAVLPGGHSGHDGAIAEGEPRRRTNEDHRIGDEKLQDKTIPRPLGRGIVLYR